MTKAKKSPYDQKFIELWVNAQKQTPALTGKKEQPNQVSNILLIHDKAQGVVPGIYTRWNQPHYVNPHYTIGVGEGIYSDMHGNILKDVLFFYPVAKLPVIDGEHPEAEEETAVSQ